MLAISGIAWLVLKRRYAQRGYLVRHASRRPVPWGLMDVLVLHLLYVALTAAALGVLSSSAAIPPLDRQDAAPAWPAPLVMLGATGLVQLGTLLLGVAYLRYARQAEPDDLGWSTARLGHDVRLGLLAFVAVLGPIYTLQLVLTRWVGIPSEHPIVNVLGDRMSPGVLVLSTLVVVVLAPLIEEFLYRGLLQGWLERYEAHQRATAEPGAMQLRAGWMPIAASSLVFAAMHVGHGPDPIPLFFLALALGYLYYRTHRLWPSIVLHAALNGMSMLFYWLAVYTGTWNAP